MVKNSGFTLMMSILRSIAANFTTGTQEGQPKTPFTNAEQIRLSLKDDKWTVDAFSLRTSEDKSPFIQLTGTFDAKSEAIDLCAKSDGFALTPFGTALGLPLDMLQTGTGRYILKTTGTSKQPRVALDWTIPMLDLKTEVGDIRISDAGGAIVYRDNLMRLEKTALKLLGNAVDIGGEIDVHPEDVSKSRLNLNVNARDLELTTFGELIAQASAKSIKAEDLTGGTLAGFNRHHRHPCRNLNRRKYSDGTTVPNSPRP